VGETQVTTLAIDEVEHRAVGPQEAGDLLDSALEERRRLAGLGDTLEDRRPLPTPGRSGCSIAWHDGPRVRPTRFGHLTCARLPAMGWEPPTTGDRPDGAVQPSESQTAPTVMAPPVRWEPPVQAPPPDQAAAPGLVFAGVPPRLVAWIVDILIVGLLSIIVVAVLVAFFPADGSATLIASTVVSVSIDLAYFVGLWTSSRRATPGMRLLALQIGNAADGRTLTPEQAVRRWLAMGSPLPLLAVVPALAGITNLVIVVLLLILVVSIASSPTKQGLHDRFASSAIVRPAGRNDAAIVGCVLLLVVGVGLVLVSIVALIYLGAQVEEVLSDIGTSI
jgi:uncharacterized RDD family membrane protein YckC